MTTTKRFWFYAFALFGAAFMLFSSCEKENIPVLSTTEVTEITQTTAISGGNITDDGGATVTARGVCWSTSQNPTIYDSKTEDGTGAGSFTSSISGLEPNTMYYIRAYATNNAGTSYGSVVSVTTLRGAIDADGNFYATVIIGNQEWFAENLRTTKYNDGSSIPTGHTNEQWQYLYSDAYAIYPHSLVDGLSSDAETLQAYGALYNWFAVQTGKLCPSGWHVPSSSEWSTLIDYAGGTSIAGGKLKSTRTAPDAHPRWVSPNIGAIDEYSFSAFPGGLRSGFDGDFFNLNNVGIWWTSSWIDNSYSMFYYIGNDSESAFSSKLDRSSGASIRCVRDN